MKQGAERYSAKTEDYAKYRPDFPPEILEFLYTNDALTNSSIIADIGSGTGRLTRLLLEQGNQVYGVEQNNEMRIKAEELLTGFKNFKSISGSAEQTGLRDNLVDLITVAQAFHWFNKDLCLVEFKRILKDSGKVLIVWDDFIGDYNDFSKEYGKIVSSYKVIKHPYKQKKLTRAEMIDGFFKNNNYLTMAIIHELYQGFESFKGGVLSASFTPNSREKNYEPFITELQKVFNKYERNGKVCTAFRVVCYLGQM